MQILVVRYTCTTSQDRQRKRIKLRNYKKKMKRHLEVMKAIGDNVARTKPQKVYITAFVSFTGLVSTTGLVSITGLVSFTGLVSYTTL